MKTKYAEKEHNHSDIDKLIIWLYTFILIVVVALFLFNSIKISKLEDKLDSYPDYVCENITEIKEMTWKEFELEYTYGWMINYYPNIKTPFYPSNIEYECGKTICLVKITDEVCDFALGGKDENN